MKPRYQPSIAAAYRIRRPRWMTWYRYTRWRWHVLFALVDAIGWGVLGPWKLMRRLLRQPNDAPLRSILVVQLDHFGDAVMSLGLLRSLRRKFPEAQLEVLCSPWNQELFEACGDVDRLHVMEVTRFSRRDGLGWVIALLRWGWRLRRRKFDLAIDVRGEFPHAWLMWLAGARRRFGWACGGGGFLLTDRVRYQRGRHEVLSRTALLDVLGDGATDSMPRFEPDDQAVQCVREQLGGELWQRPLLVFHIDSGTEAKRWPVSRWEQLSRQVVDEYRANIVLVGRKPQPLQPHPSHLSNVLNWTGQLSIPRLAALLSQADLFVGPDSGPAHLAAAVGTPVVALFSGTNDPEQWKPYGRNVAVVRHVPACSPCHRETCPWADHPCMHGLSPEVVMDHVRAMLDGRSDSPPVGKMEEVPA